MSGPFNPRLRVSEVEVLLPFYHKIEWLDEGGQGCVFKAVCLGGTSVAIKIYSPDQLEIRAELEVQKLKAVDSPFVVKLLEYGYLPVRGRTCFYSITRYEKGMDLRRCLQRDGFFPEEQTGELITSICKAVDSLWRVRVVHCDIKPENILSGADGFFRLIDLGLAKHLDIDRRITPTGVVMGTPGYVAPEQMRGRKNLTLRADLFALGIVAYECLTGQHPFQRDQLRIASGICPERPSQHVSVSHDMERVIMALMEFNPLYRPASGVEVIAMLGGK